MIAVAVIVIVGCGKKTPKEEPAPSKDTNIEETQSLEATPNPADIKHELWNEAMQEGETGEYPQKRLEKAIEQTQQYYNNIAKEQGIDLAEYVENNLQISKEEFDKQVEAQAKRNLDKQLAAEAIAKRENIKVDSKAYQEGIKKLADKYGYESTEALEKEFPKDQLEELVLQSLVEEWLLENSR